MQGAGLQTACRWPGDARLPVPVVPVKARTVLIASDTVFAPAVPGGSAGSRVCHLMTRRLTRAGPSHPGAAT